MLAALCEMTSTTLPLIFVTWNHMSGGMFLEDALYSADEREVARLS